MEELAGQPVVSDTYENHRSISWQATGGRLAKRLLAAAALTTAFGATPTAAQPLSSERGVVIEHCVGCTFSPEQVSALGGQAMQQAHAEVIVPSPTNRGKSGRLFPKPHLEIGSEDDAVVASSNLARMATATEQARSMGASWWRAMIFPKDIFESHWKQYDLAVSEATREGLNVTLTLACNEEHWTDQTFQRYVTAVVKRYDRRGVREYSICNEPNYPQWLDRMPGETLPQTYRQLYQIGYAAVKAQAELDGVNDSVFIFELSSEVQPIQFIKGALACPPGSSTCPPLETDGFAYHPYQLSTSPTKSSKVPGEVGIGSLPVL
ncbi:MAG TPA: hypothetical protein VK712_02545, partial [Verrucomicrobiae bacterium]|nr:hypothetical protein [Verrucomicrobiae bacterium]